MLFPDPPVKLVENIAAATATIAIITTAIKIIFFYSIM